ncbi:MAG: FecR family protein [bacterium]
MRKRSFFPLLVIILASLVGGLSWRVPQDKKDVQAFVMKVVNDVQKKAPTSGWQKTIMLDGLKSGYEIRTEPKSLAIIKFVDDTKLVVREKSIVMIQGEALGKEILNRNVHMTRGKIGFEVKKGEKEQFRFSSPISVASIRGTDGDFNVADDSVDVLVIKVGLATHTNLLSNKSNDVGAGQTSITDGKGNLNVRGTVPGDLGKDDDDKTTTTTTTVTVLGTTAFDPPPSVGVATTLKLDLGQTAANINSVTLYYRMEGASDWTSLAMQLAEKVASATIPGTGIRAGKLQYYFSVNHSDNKSAMLPMDGPAAAVSVDVIVPVMTTGDVKIEATPIITPSPLAALTTASVKLDLSSVQQDIDGVKLFYRKAGAGSFTVSEIKPLSSKVLTWTIPAASVFPPQIEYYFAIKVKNVINEVLLPTDGVSNPKTSTVSPIQINFELARLTAYSKITAGLGLSTIQAPIGSVSIYTRSGDQPTFKQTLMTVSGSIASFTLPGILVRPPRLDYYLALRLADGTELLFPSGGESAPRGVGVTSLVLTPTFGVLQSGSPGAARLDLGKVDADIQSVTMYHRKDNDATFKQVQMTLSGKTATAQIEGADVKFPFLVTYFVARLADGSELLVPENGTTAPRKDPVTPVKSVVRVEGEDKDGNRRIIYIEIDQ